MAEELIKNVEKEQVFALAGARGRRGGTGRQPYPLADAGLQGLRCLRLTPTRAWRATPLAGDALVTVLEGTGEITNQRGAPPAGRR